MRPAWLVSIVMLLAVPTAAAAADAPSWRALSRFNPDDVHAHSVLIDPGSATCAGKPKQSWTVDGQPRPVSLVHDPDSKTRCHAVITLRGATVHTIRTGTGDGIRVPIRDRLIVLLGESAPGARRCGRDASDVEQAVRLLAGGLRHTSATFVDFSCPDATVRSTRERQIARLERLLRQRTIGAVVLRVGARDVGGEILSDCARVPRCPSTRRLGVRTAQALGRIGRSLDRLARRLVDSGVPPRRRCCWPIPT
jgi:hypothetical protein